MRRCVLVGIAAHVCLAAGRSAWGYHVEVRFVERVGTVDTPIALNSLPAGPPGSSHRIRIQFGVFDDGGGPAPVGGFIGWNVGTLAITGGPNTRTPGRLAPWNFPPNPPGNGLPSTDPFTVLTSIDNTLGFQTLVWSWMSPTTPPAAVVRGDNAFVSLNEITTVESRPDYDLIYSGREIVASGWGVISQTPPDPDTMTDGSITYAPQTLPPVPFTAVLVIYQPAPGAAAVLGVGSLVLMVPRRRRPRGW